MLRDYAGMMAGGMIIATAGSLMLNNPVNVIYWLITYSVLCTQIWCIGHHFSNTAQASPAGTDGRPAGDEDALTQCPCCKRQYYPIIDISNRRMCPWCGHYVGRWF